MTELPTMPQFDAVAERLRGRNACQIARVSGVCRASIIVVRTRRRMVSKLTLDTIAEALDIIDKNPERGRAVIGRPVK